MEGEGEKKEKKRCFEFATFRDMRILYWLGGLFLGTGTGLEELERKNVDTGACSCSYQDYPVAGMQRPKPERVDSHILQGQFTLAVCQFFGA